MDKIRYHVKHFHLNGSDTIQKLKPKLYPSKLIASHVQGKPSNQPWPVKVQACACARTGSLARSVRGASVLCGANAWPQVWLARTSTQPCHVGTIEDQCCSEPCRFISINQAVESCQRLGLTNVLTKHGWSSSGLGHTPCWPTQWLGHMPNGSYTRANVYMVRVLGCEFHKMCNRVTSTNLGSQPSPVKTQFQES